MSEKFAPAGSSTTSDPENKGRKEVLAKIPRTENVIFVGSEMHDSHFWTKMMFMSAAYALARDRARFRPADKKTLAYVDVGYVHTEKIALDNLGKTEGFNIIKLGSSSDLISILNNGRDDYKLQDVAFFSHGIPGEISLNFQGGFSVALTNKNLSSINKNSFLSNGRMYSYACRTGVNSWAKRFDSEDGADIGNSLAQKMANHFGIEVHAFLRRSSYRRVLREIEKSATIASTLKAARAAKEGQVIDIPPEHEALPHPGLADSFIPLSGPKREGTAGYALWRKQGGIALPVGGDSPEGLSAEIRVFKPVV